jgi:hypothetical protein
VNYALSKSMRILTCTLLALYASWVRNCVRELKAAVLDFRFGVPKLAPFDELHHVPSTCKSCPYPGISVWNITGQRDFYVFFGGEAI